MMIAVTDLLPAKLLKEGLSIPLYEGHIERDHLSLTLRETRHIEPAFISRALVTVLNFVADLPADQQLLVQRLFVDLAHGRECKHIDLNGQTLLFFPDQRGDPDHHLFLDVTRRVPVQKNRAKPTAKTRAKSVTAPPKAKLTRKADVKK